MNERTDGQTNERTNEQSQVWRWPTNYEKRSFFQKSENPEWGNFGFGDQTDSRATKN